VVGTAVAARILGRAPGSVAGSAVRSAIRIGAVTSRNVSAVRHSGYWLVVISGFLEPVLYLLSIGVGVGGLVGSLPVAHGQVVSYAAFVAPAMLAASAMNGAMAESTFNFFARLKWMKLYDAMVATPLRPFEIALGELGWALIRGMVYSVAFLGLMVWLGLTTVGWAAAALPATMLVGLAFGTAGMAVTTVMRSWQDFDYVAVGQMGLFLFSGTFAPVRGYPPLMRAVVEVTPLAQAVELVRHLTTGQLTWSVAANVAYLVAMSAVGLAIAARRTTRILCR
jgi:lipooligosaccharide transport system permease protein